MNDPDILVLDEPTTGLDPQARLLVWEKLTSLREAGLTLLLTTHYMEEAARLCNRVAIIDEGKILAQGTPEQLIAQFAAADVLEIIDPAAAPTRRWSTRWTHPASRAVWRNPLPFQRTIIGCCCIA